MSFHIFEGRLPLNTSTSPSFARAAAICLTRDAFKFVSYEGYRVLIEWFATRKPQRYHITFNEYVRHATTLINRRFAGSGYFRLVLYESRLYLQIMYDVDYGNVYSGPCTSHVYVPKTALGVSDVVGDWEFMWRGKLTPDKIIDYNLRRFYTIQGMREHLKAE